MQNNISKNILDSIMPDEVEDSDDYLEEYKTIAIYTIDCDMADRIVPILSRSNFIDKFKQPEIMQNNCDEICIHFIQNSNASLEDLCKMIQAIHMKTNHEWMWMSFEKCTLHYKLNFKDSEDDNNKNYENTAYDITIVQKNDFMNFFKKFFPDNPEKEILKTFFRSCFKYNDAADDFSPEHKWFTIKIVIGINDKEIGTNDEENFINRNGDFLFNDNRTIFSINRFHDGYAKLFLENAFCYIDENGKVLECVKKIGECLEYVNCCPDERFKNGYAKVTKQYINPNSAKCNFMYNFINTKGEIILDKWYDKLDEIKDGTVLATENNRQNLIDITGNKKFPELPSDYEYASHFINGFAIIRTISGLLRYNIIDEYGKPVSDKWFYLCNNFFDGWAVVMTSTEKYNYIDSNGRFMFKNDRWLCRNFCNGYAIVSDNNNENLWNIIDTSGNEISKFSFWEVGNVINGFAIVKKSRNQCNFIGIDGNLISPDKWFSKCDDFINGIARVESDNYPNKFNFINKKGTILLPEWIDKTEPFKIENNLIIFKRSSRCYDLEGNFISLI